MWREEYEQRYEECVCVGGGHCRGQDEKEKLKRRGTEPTKCEVRDHEVGRGMYRKPHCVLAIAISCLCASCTSLLPVVPRKSVSHSSSDQPCVHVQEASQGLGVVRTCVFGFLADLFLAELNNTFAGDQH